MTPGRFLREKAETIFEHVALLAEIMGGVLVGLILILAEIVAGFRRRWYGYCEPICLGEHLEPVRNWKDEALQIVAFKCTRCGRRYRR